MKAILFSSRKAVSVNQPPSKREPGEWKDGKLVGFAPPHLYPVGAEWFFARWCALECLHLWDPPQIVREYLETGDPYLADTTRQEESRSRAGFAVTRRETALRASWWMRAPAVDGIVEYDPAWEGARMSAAYSASGFIDAAARWAITALAWDARETVRKSNPNLPLQTLMDAQNKAKETLQSIFRATALQIYRSERYA